MSTFAPLRRKSDHSNNVVAARKAAVRSAFTKPVGARPTRAALREFALGNWSFHAPGFAQRVQSNARAVPGIPLTSRKSVETEPLPIQTKLGVSEHGARTRGGSRRRKRDAHATRRGSAATTRRDERDVATECRSRAARLFEMHGRAKR